MMAIKKKITVQKFLYLMMFYGILSPAECVEVLSSGMLPDDVLERLMALGKKMSN